MIVLGLILQDLPTLLEEIGCSKHLHVFKEQDIDLRIFLTLTEAELKEIGIKYGAIIHNWKSIIYSTEARFPGP